jgi:hypothetical protein
MYACVWIDVWTDGQRLIDVCMCSDQIDLSNPHIYRDLSQPMGRLNSNRWAIYEERYESLRRDSHSEHSPPPFHYGSHYSSPGIVLYFLLRKAPFTQLHIDLQGGAIDLADRLFGSVATAWRLGYNEVADVKELIPEFYSGAGDFLVNSQKLDLGVRQDGKRVGDVELPPWAASPAQFVGTLRSALESPFVSSRLHLWIDLIFGYKQQGPAAVEAGNVFFHLTYDGNKALEALVDPSPAARKAMEDQIKHFGQTPAQLFRAPHPPKAEQSLSDEIKLQAAQAKTAVADMAGSILRSVTERIL